MKLGIIGFGTIGRCVASHVLNGYLDYELTAVCNTAPDVAAAWLNEHGSAAGVATMDTVCRSCDVVIESAAAEAVSEVLAACRPRVSDASVPAHVVILSVGGLLEVSLDEIDKWDRPVVHVPGGAIGGLEAIQAMKVAGLDSVTLTTRKPPAGLGMDVTEETVLFEGSAREVFARYPKNINVAIALSLAGIGPEKTKVRLLADPAVEQNTHHIVASGSAGTLEFISRNEPFPENPRTSYLAALSAIALLKRIRSGLQVG